MKPSDLFWQLGDFVPCHRIPERSFFYKGKQFPMCARCTGCSVGYIVGGIVFLFYRTNFFILLGFCMIMFIDWFLQYMGIKESTNLRRFITGFFCGVAMIQFYMGFFTLVYGFFRNIASYEEIIPHSCTPVHF